ncbi:MAG: hypothetical protein FJ290_19965 [Planctomycetes bacterium]|nr:hypothetical protein [Planctomycetota bacterium]
MAPCAARLPVVLLLLASAAPAADLIGGAKWEYSTDDGATWGAAPPVVPGGNVAAILAKTSFHLLDLSAFVALELTQNVPPEQKVAFDLNGQPLPVPLKGMVYRTVPAIPPAAFRKGKNELTARINFDNRPKKADDPLPDPATVALEVSLAGLQPSDLRMHTGPILGAVTETSFSVTCCTNLPVVVTLAVELVRTDGRRQRADGRRQTSEPGLFHRFRVEGLDPQAKWTYRLSVDQPPYRLEGKPWPVKLAPAQGRPLRMVFMGDCRSRPRDWAAVAAAALKADPDLVVFNGDMTACGRYDWLWTDEFHAPAAELLATVPVYPVMGNHEENAPVYPLLFYTPGGDGSAKNWVQQIGPVLLIAYDTAWSRARDADFPAWFKRNVDASTAKFIFFFTHYPAWSSGKSTTIDPRTRLPEHSGSRFARQAVLPLLGEMRATAIFASHEHFYERSDLPGGLTHIISGRAGAPAGRRNEKENNNPYSKVFAADLHYCLLEVTGDTCSLRAITPEGGTIDSLTWRAREKEM